MALLSSFVKVEFTQRKSFVVTHVNYVMLVSCNEISSTQKEFFTWFTYAENFDSKYSKPKEPELFEKGQIFDHNTNFIFQYFYGNIWLVFFFVYVIIPYEIFSHIIGSPHRESTVPWVLIYRSRINLILKRVFIANCLCGLPSSSPERLS